MFKKYRDSLITAVAFIFIVVCILISSRYDTPSLWNNILMMIEAK